MTRAELVLLRGALLNAAAMWGQSRNMNIWRRQNERALKIVTREIVKLMREVKTSS